MKKFTFIELFCLLVMTLILSSCASMQEGTGSYIQVSSLGASGILSLGANTIGGVRVDTGGQTIPYGLTLTYKDGDKTNVTIKWPQATIVEAALPATK
jgi:hypothetical protein